MLAAVSPDEQISACAAASAGDFHNSLAYAMLEDQNAG